MKHNQTPYGLFVSQVRERLRKKHRISWVKGFAAFGEGRLLEFYRTGNMIDRTVDAMAYVYKQGLSHETK